MLVIVSCFQHWRVQLEETLETIRVVSDHKVLEYFMTTVMELGSGARPTLWEVAVAHISRVARYVAIHLPPSPCFLTTTKALTARQARWVNTLSQFNFQITYKPGITNRADTFTRREQDLNN
jgi:hypothetical protein